MTDSNQKQLGNTLWSIADQLRGAVDPTSALPHNKSARSAALGLE